MATEIVRLFFFSFLFFSFLFFSINMGVCNCCYSPRPEGWEETGRAEKPGVWR